MLLAVAFLLISAFSPCLALETLTPEPLEYTKFVHNYLDSSKGNWTSVEKPMFPVFFNESQIAIGGNWSIVESLVANKTYHVYCFGDWVNNGSKPKTNYDIYVYNPRGILESTHTEAAGLVEQLGTRENDIYFVPQVTGNYTFLVINNAGSSNGTQAATFMTIENIDTNRWHTQKIDGRNSDSSTKFSTSWAYEFVTDGKEIEVYVKVPTTLDMYEARLYRMSDSESFVLNDLPLPWESGLYGNISDSVGGYNLDSEHYRGVAYASCESNGEDMIIRFSNTTEGITLYQLVLIGEIGYGNVDFIIKTQFDGAALTLKEQLGRIYPNNQTTITCISSNTALESAVLKYSTDKWDNTEELQMTVMNMNCSAIIPAQKAGTQVLYRVVANDTLMNNLRAEGNYTVKQSSRLNITAIENNIRVGDNITITGVLTGQTTSSPISVLFMSALYTETAEVKTLPDGTFTASAIANSSGVWAVQAYFIGGDIAYSSDSNQLAVQVEELSFVAANGMYIGSGFFVAMGVIGAVLFIKGRRE
jgi:hypothetical protein